MEQFCRPGDVPENSSRRQEIVGSESERSRNSVQKNHLALLIGTVLQPGGVANERNQMAKRMDGDDKGTK